MSKRTSIITTLISHIESQTSASGYRGLRFLHEINSFPAFYIHPEAETRIHISSDTRHAVISCSLRGYQHSDNLDDIEDFARTLEAAIDSFSSTLVEEIRVTSLRTDEGLLEPYGVVDMRLEILYVVNPFISIRADSTQYTTDSTIVWADRI
jgi:hypothetical protein